ncbi:MAG: hypothetical protein HKP41_11790, partial [Desulfobacterales bacterium]|nr:hypothetical protein [Desulfobacterales bacterium]
MKQTCFKLFTVAVLCLFMSGAFTLAVADKRKDNSTTSRSDNSGTTQPSIKTSVKRPEKLPEPVPTSKQAPNRISTPPSRIENVVTGFCCKDGSLEETTEDVCLKKLRGKFFPDKNIALKSCKGWCCDEFEVSLTSSKQCTATQGKFFANKAQAGRYCAAQKGWCCEEGANLRLTMSQ